MKTISVIGIIVLIVVVAGVYLLVKPPMQTTKIPDTTVTTQEASILEDQINALTEAEIALITTDISDFALAEEDLMAADMGQFYY